jgi:hypothetical protein
MAADIFFERDVEIKDAIAYAIAMASEPRTALLIRCSKEHAVHVREQARAEHRSVSGCLLRAMERSLWVEETFGKGFRPFLPQPFLKSVRPAGSEAALFLRCSVSEAERIREAAARRNMSISRFVIFSLERQWEAARKLQEAK